MPEDQTATAAAQSEREELRRAINRAMKTGSGLEIERCVLRQQSEWERKYYVEHEAYIDLFDQLSRRELAEEKQSERERKLLEALKILHDETEDYIRINDLGDPHHNRSMQLARAAIREAEARA